MAGPADRPATEPLAAFDAELTALDGTRGMPRPKWAIERLRRAVAEAAQGAAPRTEGLDVERVMGEVLDLFLPFLDDPHPPQDRQRRLDERMQKSYALDAILSRPSDERVDD